MLELLRSRGDEKRRSNWRCMGHDEFGRINDYAKRGDEEIGSSK